MTQIQRMVKAIEKITDGERAIRIFDHLNMDMIDIKRKDIVSFSYPVLDNKVVYIDFVLPFIERDGKRIEIVYQTYSRRGTVKRSGDVLRNFVIDKDCDLIAL